MTKTIVILLSLLIVLGVNGEKATEKSEGTDDTAEYIKIDEDDDISGSLQFVHMDIIKDKGDTIIKHDYPQNNDHYSEENRNKNSTDGNTEPEKLSEDSSDSDEIIFNADSNHEELIIPSDTIRENNAEIEVIIEHEHITKEHDQIENDQKNVMKVSEEDNSNWRSAENFNSGVREDSVEEINDEISAEDENDDSLENYEDKKLSVNIMDRVEARNPERQEHNVRRPYHMRHYGPPDDRSVMESGSLRSLSEIMLPRLRPTLTRNRIMYSPALFSIQPTGPLLDRFSGHNWPKRIQVNPEREFFNKPRHHPVLSLPQYEDSKMIDDYNDYGANAYSYSPGLKATTPTPPRQVVAPNNKFDIFKKLAEASHSKPSQRTINDNMFPGNYYPQRQYSESYGPFDVRKFRRNAWDDEPFRDI